MKKLIKNYLAKLQENDKKGFSLVELIIVMAIMAILVGVVASQVLPYMEKSRLSKDQEALASIQMDISSAIAMSGEAVAGGTDTLANLKNVANATAESEFMSLRSLQNMPTITDLKFKSNKIKDTTGADVFVTVSNTTGEITVFVGTSTTSGPIDPKLTVTSTATGGN